MQLGTVLAQSGFFQDSKQAAQAVVKVLAGRELGFGPIASMTGVNIIQGRVTLSANLIAAAIKKSGRYDYQIKEHTNKRCVLTFFDGANVMGESSFGIEDAQMAGLMNNANWKKWPRNMMFARAISNGAKWYCPDVFTTGVYTPDELGAEVDAETGEVIEAPWTKVQFVNQAKANFDMAPQHIGQFLTSAGLMNGDGYNPDRIDDYWQELVNVQSFAKKVADQVPYYTSQHQIYEAMVELEMVYSKDDEAELLAKLDDHARKLAEKEEA
jgi:hypothetical protein